MTSCPFYNARYITIVIYEICRLGKDEALITSKPLAVVASFVVLFVLLLLATSAIAAAAGLGVAGTADLEAFFDAIIHDQMHEVGIAGVTLSVVSGGEVILSKGYGDADVNRKIPVDPDRTLFRIGSISKLFVWTAIMQLAEQGKLDLHADVQQYLDFELPVQLLGAPSGSVAPPITLVHLMTHSAGFEDVAQDLFHLHPEHTLPLEQYIRTHVPARVFPPGEVSAYSNYGSALAGYIVQRVSGMPFAQYVEQHIFAPLRMTNSTFRQPVEDALSTNIARGYRRIGGEFVEGAFVYALAPAGGMSSSASDMARFMLAYLQDGVLDGQRILSEETIRQRRRIFRADGPVRGVYGQVLPGG